MLLLSNRHDSLKARSFLYRNTVKPMFSVSKEFSGTMNLRPHFSKCDHGDCYSFIFGLPFYQENAQGLFLSGQDIAYLFNLMS